MGDGRYRPRAGTLRGSRHQGLVGRSGERPRGRLPGFRVRRRPRHRSIDPYPSPDSDTLLSADAVYPPFVFVVAVPISFLPFVASASIWLALLIAASIATPWLVGVRDPRCFGLWLVSAPVVADVMWGNATILVGLGAALAWHFRDDARLAGAALGAGAAVKILLAPLVVWLVFTRRFRASVLSVVICATLVLVCWAAIGFAGIVDYPAVIRRLAQAQTGGGLFLSGLLAAHGWSANSAVAVGAVPALVLFSLAWYRRRHDAAAFALVLLAILWITPVNHVFNLVLMMLAVAVIYPRLSVPWALMPLLWIVAFSGPVYRTHHDALTAISMTFAVIATVAVMKGSRSSPTTETGIGSVPHVSPGFVGEVR